MRTTGYTDERAAPHEQALARVAETLNERGYGPVTLLAVDGHRPDARLASGDYVEVKTGSPNIAIELNSLAECRRLETRGDRVYIVHAGAATPTLSWTVDTPDSVTARIIGGPRRRSGSGSNDDWYLVTTGGAPFDAFFPESRSAPLPMPPRCATYAECDDNPYIHCPTCWAHLAGIYAVCADHPGLPT